MKCVNCGFSCDDESVCPICGTPVKPAKEPGAHYAAPYPSARHYAPTASSYAPPASSYRQPPAPKEPKPKKPLRENTSNGLRIAALCVLSVIAAALVYIAVIQTIGLCHDIDRGGRQISCSGETKPPKEKAEEKSTSPDRIQYPDHNSKASG